jgi:hypothetical protein
MYNQILSEGSFPSKWGEVSVVPILKAGKTIPILPAVTKYLTSFASYLREW